MRDTTWVRIDDVNGVNAEVEFDRTEYDNEHRVIMGRLTGRVMMHWDAVRAGLDGLPLPGDDVTEES